MRPHGCEHAVYVLLFNFLNFYLVICWMHRPDEHVDLVLQKKSDSSTLVTDNLHLGE